MKKATTTDKRCVDINDRDCHLAVSESWLVNNVTNEWYRVPMIN